VAGLEAISPQGSKVARRIERPGAAASSPQGSGEQPRDRRGRPNNGERAAPRNVAFDLGFSDVATVFVNGLQVFRGDASYSFDRPRREGIGFD
jgi:hypothetical protein